MDELFTLLGVNVNELSPRASELLDHMVEYKNLTKLDILTPMSVYCWYVDKKMKQMESESYNLHLKQNITKLEKIIDKEKNELELLQECLKEEKEKCNKFACDEYIRKKSTFENKVSTYETKLNELTLRVSKQKIPPEILPQSIKCLEKEIESTKLKHAELKTVVDHMNLAKSAKKDLLKLRQNNNIFNQLK